MEGEGYKTTVLERVGKGHKMGQKKCEKSGFAEPYTPNGNVEIVIRLGTKMGNLTRFESEFPWRGEGCRGDANLGFVEHTGPVRIEAEAPTSPSLLARIWAQTARR